MPQKTFTIKFSKMSSGAIVEINASAHPYENETLIGSNWVPCSVFNWLRKSLPDNKTAKVKVTIEL